MSKWKPTSNDSNLFLGNIKIITWKKVNPHFYSDLSNLLPWFSDYRQREFTKDIKNEHWASLLPSDLDDLNNSQIDDLKAQLSIDKWMRMKSFTDSKDETSSSQLEWVLQLYSLLSPLVGLSVKLVCLSSCTFLVCTDGLFTAKCMVCIFFYCPCLLERHLCIHLFGLLF